MNKEWQMKMNVEMKRGEFVRCEGGLEREARGWLRVKEKKDEGKDGGGEEKKRASKGGEVVVLRSERMSAYPLSGEGGSLCLSLHSFMPRFEGGKGR